MIPILSGFGFRVVRAFRVYGFRILGSLQGFETRVDLGFGLCMYVYVYVYMYIYIYIYI